MATIGSSLHCPSYSRGVCLIETQGNDTGLVRNCQPDHMVNKFFNNQTTVGLGERWKATVDCAVSQNQEMRKKDALENAPLPKKKKYNPWYYL